VTILAVLERLGDDISTARCMKVHGPVFLLLPFPAKDILADVARALGTDAGGEGPWMQIAETNLN
jgi:hypothetical protein